LRGFTTDAAWAAFMEHDVGRLAPGMRADFVVLADDPLANPPAMLPTLGILSTWVDGARVFDATIADVK
jgi:predicted amidohydrolase YtcJ